MNRFMLILVGVPSAAALVACGGSEDAIDGEAVGGTDGVPPGHGDDAGGESDCSGGDDGGVDEPVPVELPFDCPTAVPEPLDISIGSTTARFAAACGACHGIDGTGTVTAPDLTAASVTLDRFLEVARAGSTEMPAQSEASISDASLSYNWAVLHDEPLPELPADDALPPRTPPSQWTDAEIDAAYERGLQAWRSPDALGMACAHCHSPDGLDLALMGFDDADILRRGSMHLTPERSLEVVDFIAAQRLRWGLEVTCDPRETRAFQPGGAPLPAGEEGELIFAQQVADAGLLIATGEVRSIEEAHQAVDELIAHPAIDFPTPMVFPHWTEDGFHDGTHSLNDWITNLAFVPRQLDDEGLFALHDAYMAEPTEARIQGLIDMVRDDDAYMPLPALELPGATAVSEGAGNVGLLLGRHKLAAQLSGQHALRNELLGRDDHPVRVDGNAIWRVGIDAFGNFYPSDNCFGTPGDYDTIDLGCVGFYHDQELEALADMQATPRFGIGNRWFSMAQMLDPTMTLLPYWAAPLTTTYPISGFYLLHSSLAVKLTYGGPDGLPNEEEDPTVPGVLDHKRMSYSDADFNFGAAFGWSEEVGAVKKTINENVFRTWLYLMREQLEAGHMVSDRAALAFEVRKFNHLSKPTEDYLALVEEVLALIEVAPQSDYYPPEDRIICDPICNE